MIKGAAGRLDKKPLQLPYVLSSKNAGKMAAAVVEGTKNIMGIRNLTHFHAFKFAGYFDVICCLFDLIVLGVVGLLTITRVLENLEKALISFAEVSSEAGIRFHGVYSIQSIADI